MKFLSDGLDSCSSSNEVDSDNKCIQKTINTNNTINNNNNNKENTSIIEIEYDGNPNELIVNFEELESDPTRYQMIIGNYKHLLAAQQKSNESTVNSNSNQVSKAHNTLLYNKFSSYRNKYNCHKRARLSINRN